MIRFRFATESTTGFVAHGWAELVCHNLPFVRLRPETSHIDVTGLPGTRTSRTITRPNPPKLARPLLSRRRLSLRIHALQLAVGAFDFTDPENNPGRTPPYDRTSVVLVGLRITDGEPSVEPVDGQTDRSRRRRYSGRRNRSAGVLHSSTHGPRLGLFH